jgi:hypothetical protein
MRSFRTPDTHPVGMSGNTQKKQSRSDFYRKRFTQLRMKFVG